MRFRRISSIVAVTVWLAQVVIAQSSVSVDLIGNAAPLDYRGSVVKTSGWSAGGYAGVGIGLNHRLEAAMSATHLEYVDTSTLDQTDWTGTYTHYGKKMQFRLGAHHLLSDHSATDGTTTLFAAAGPYVPYLWYSEVAVYYTGYRNYRDETATLLPEGFRAIQLSPRIGFNIGDVLRGRYLYAEIAGHLIHLDQELSYFGLQEQNFVSLEMLTQFTTGPWVLTGFAWAGEQAFAVRAKGFSVYNLVEKHTGGFGLSAKRIVGRSTAFTLGIFSEQFRDIGYAEEVSLTVIQASLGVTI